MPARHAAFMIDMTMSALPPDATSLLDFWFADATTSYAAARRRLDLWFGHHPDFDAALTARFDGWPARALNGEFAHWRATARGTLALLIVLDQLPRNLYRGSPRAYACDAAAQAIALAAEQDDMAGGLHSIEVPFFYLPYEHAEDLDLQRRCIAGYEREHARAPAEYVSIFVDCLKAAHDHHEVVERFGRFPHRNAILGRPSTAAELEYLGDGGKHWHQVVPAASGQA